MNIVARMLFHWGLRRICARIRAAHPELAELVDDKLVVSYLELATREMVKVEASHIVSGDEPTAAYPQPSQLMVDALPYFNDADRSAFVLLTMQQHVALDQLKAEKAWLEERLELALKLNSLYEDREIVFQQVLDEAGIDAEMIDRMSVNVGKRSMDIDNRSN